jgi:hypothetical protein
MSHHTILLNATLPQNTFYGFCGLIYLPGKQLFKSGTQKGLRNRVSHKPSPDPAEERSPRVRARERASPPPDPGGGAHRPLRPRSSEGPLCLPEYNSECPLVYLLAHARKAITIHRRQQPIPRAQPRRKSTVPARARGGAGRALNAPLNPALPGEVGLALTAANRLAASWARKTSVSSAVLALTAGDSSVGIRCGSRPADSAPCGLRAAGCGLRAAGCGSRPALW